MTMFESPATEMQGRMPSPPRAHGLRTIVFIALRQLWDRKLLNGIALGGIALGVFTLVVMHGVMEGFERKFTTSILKATPHVSISDTELRPAPPLLNRLEGADVVARIAHQSPRERRSRIKRPDEILLAMRGMPEIEAAAASAGGMVLLEFAGKTCSIDLRGIDVVQQEKVTPIGRYATSGDIAVLAFSADALAVGSGVAEELGLKVGDMVRGAAPGGAPMSFKVVAIFEVGIPPMDKSRGYTTLRTAQAALGRPDDVNRIEARLTNPDQAPQVAERLERMLGHDAESWQQTNANSLNLLVMQNMIASFVLGSLLVVGGFGILAVQIMIVLQKQRDIAILRSVGFRRADILWIFLSQGVVLALGGAVVGSGLAKVALEQLAHLKVQTEAPGVKSETFLVWDDPKFYLFALAFALAIGVAASVLPAWRGSKVEPVEVLRGMVG